MFVDNQFYLEEKDNMKNLPLIIGKNSNNLWKKQLFNTILLPTVDKYDFTLASGVYKAALVGVFALTLAIYFIKKGEIYLLGYDFGGNEANLDKKGRIITHFYQKELNHRGIGKVAYYNTLRRGHNDFKYFRDIEEITIYNVSPKSKLEEFPKIDYNTFFNKLDSINYNQKELRKNIINKIKDLRIGKFNGEPLP
jgi:hypothetical protein